MVHAVHNHLSITNQTTEPDEIFTLEDAARAVTAYIASFDENSDINTLIAADIGTKAHDTIAPHESHETFNASQASAVKAKNLNSSDSSNTHIVTANAIIPHDPSLEITVKSNSTFTETVSNEVLTNITISELDPMDICAITYSPQNDNISESIDCDSFGTGTSCNYITVPKDVKIIINSKQKICKPRAYDRKRAHTRTVKQNVKGAKKQKIQKSSGSLIPSFLATTNTINVVTASNATCSTSASEGCTNAAQVTADTATITSPLILTDSNENRDRNIPIISIPRSQIVSGSDPQFAALYNTFLPRAQTFSPSLLASAIPATTSSTLALRKYRHNSHNLSETSDLPSDFPKPVSRAIIPKILQPRNLNPAMNQPLRRSTRTTYRGRYL